MPHIPFATLMAQAPYAKIGDDSGQREAFRQFAQAGDGPDVKKIAAAMKQVLREYAVDPDKIALAGFSDGGSYSLFLGRNNLDVFSRIAAMSTAAHFVPDNTSPRNTTTQFFESIGMNEGVVMYLNALRTMQELQQEGRPVVNVVGLRHHTIYPFDDDLIWSWLKTSWADSRTAVRAASRADYADQLLTVEAITQVTAFLNRFTKEPTAILATGREANQKHITVSVGQMHILIVLMDIPAMAAKYPSVAADLKAAGLTAQQAEAYLATLISVRATQKAEGWQAPSRRLQCWRRTSRSWR